MLLANDEIAYVHAKGDFDLDLTKPGAATHFILCAVVVKQNDVKLLSLAVKEIRDAELAGAELKTDVINQGQRFRILRKLLDLPFKIISLVVDKGEIYRDSKLSTEANFVAYVGEMWEKALEQSFSNLKIVADPKSTGGFIEGFQRYVQEKKGLLFNPYEMRSAKTEECSLLQLACFITETIASGYGLTASRHYRAYLNFLQDKIVTKKALPRHYSEYLREETINLENIDKKIAKWCIKAALNYLNEHEGSIILEELNRVIIVDRLLFQLQIDAGEYLGTSKLRELIKATFGHDYSNQQFRSNIIAPLRDAGVIIASSIKGYKIPLTVDEIHSYTNQTMQMIYPMLSRLRRCREGVLEATDHKLDIMDNPEYEKMKRFFTELAKANEKDQ